MRPSPCIATLCAALVGCGHRPPPPSPALDRLPVRLSETGLFAQGGTDRIADDVQPYRPRYELWSDGADKRRWIRLPEGARIDTSDMDAWELPVGTQLWKEFARGGRRLETRLLARVAPGPDGWAAVSYVWDRDGRDALASPTGREDVLGTDHDVPSARACMACHDAEQRVLGFSAIQLAHDRVEDDALTLAALVADDRLTDAPVQPMAIAGTPVQAEALGYLHANCGSCHDGQRRSASHPFGPRASLDLWQRVGMATPLPSARQRTRIHRRMTHQPSCRRRMPPLATEHVDHEALTLVERWIATLSPPSRSHE